MSGAEPWEATEVITATSVLTLEIVIPVYNEERDLAASSTGPRGTWPPSRGRTGSPSPTTPAPTARPSSRGGWRTRYDDVRVVHLAEKGRGRALKKVWSGSEAAVARLHGRRPLDGPQRAAPARRSADHRPLRPRDRDPAAAGSRVARGPKAGAHLARLQPPAQGHPREPASPTRSAASRRSAPTWRERCSRWSRTTGGSSTPSCWSRRAGRAADPRGAGGLGRRPRQPRRHRSHRRRRRARHRPAGPRPHHRPGARGRRRRAARPGLAPTPAAVGSACSRDVRAGRRRFDARLRRALPAPAGTLSAFTANLLALLVTAVGNTAANRRLTFGVRGRGRARPPGPRADRLRDRARRHQWFTVAAARLRVDPSWCRGRRAHRCEPLRHRDAVRGDAGLGLHPPQEWPDAPGSPGHSAPPRGQPTLTVRSRTSPSPGRSTRRRTSRSGRSVAPSPPKTRYRKLWSPSSSGTR